MGEMLRQVKERRNQKWENCQNFPEPPQVSPAASSAGLKLYALAFCLLSCFRLPTFNNLHVLLSL